MTPRVREYVRIEAKAIGTTPRRVMGPSHKPKDVLARRKVWRRLRDDGFTTTQIGKWTNRDHSTVVVGLQRLALREAAQ